MNRFRKKKEPSLMEELKELELLDEGEMVDIPDLEVEDLIEENLMSVIVRRLNPYVHKVGGLVKALPPIWGLEDRTQGRVVGEDRVQFTFSSENDLQFVLTKGPWFVNGWMVAMEQWTPNPQEDFLQKITFWIRVRGLPIHMLKKQVVETLLGPLGKVETVELHAKNSNSLEYVRALTTISTEEPLQFRRTARLKSGVTIPTELEYEKLLKVCYGCKRLTHDQTRCPSQIMGSNDIAIEEQGRGKESSLRKKLMEKESKAKESLKRTNNRGVEPSICKASVSQRGGKGKSHDLQKEDKRKGKRVASAPQLVWKQKPGRGGTEKTRSTEESSANQRSSEECSGVKITPVNFGARQTTVNPIEAESVFNRLGGLEDDWGSKGSRGKRADHDTSVDLRMKLGGGSSAEKHDGKSSKGSRSPPSVFERLGNYPLVTPRSSRNAEESPAPKRKRQESSDERNPKKARNNSSEKRKISPSVFHRLGATGGSSGVSNLEEANQSAIAAVVTPSHSA
ncbi:unnamed protein product, partial [Brassica rapa]